MHDLRRRVLAEDDVRAMARCIRLCLDCVDTCVAAGRILSRQTDPDANSQSRRSSLPDGLPRVRHGVRTPCHHHEHCRLCAEECRRCERACDDLLAALRD